MPLSVGSVEYPRPGVIRARGCVVLAAGDRPSIELPLLEIESSADEDRLRIARLGADTGTAAVAVDLARRWLVRNWYRNNRRIANRLPCSDRFHAAFIKLLLSDQSVFFSLIK